jgi:CubicO group peptidase (beta-lactamase class C family)
MKKQLSSLSDDVGLQVIDRWLSCRAAMGVVPGFQASIRKKGKLVFSKAYGFANAPKGESYTNRHAAHLASHSKLVVACVALELARTGTLSLTDLVIQYLPWMKQHKDKRFREITIRDLLTHRSGIVRDGLNSYWELERPFPTSTQKLKEHALGARLIYDPNTAIRYSNIGFALLGLALGSAAGTTYEALARKIVLDKVPEARLLLDYVPGARTWAAGHTKPFYDRQRRTLRHAPASVFLPASGLCGDTDGISLFLHELCDGDKILPLALRREMMGLRWPNANSTTQYYGLGTQFEIGGGRTYFGHAGGYNGFVSQTRRLEGTDYIFSLIINANETFSFRVIQSMADIMRKIDATFPERERSRLEVTPIVMNSLNSQIYVIGRRHAVVFPLEDWQPAESSFTLVKRKDAYYSHAPDGNYSAPGEPVRFIRKGGRVVAIDICGNVSREHSDFLKRQKKAFS